MENLSKFVRREKQERWLYFTKKGDWDRIRVQLHKLDKDLNHKCVLHVKNGFSVFVDVVERKNIRHGTYIDKDGLVQINGEIQTHEILDDSVIVCRQNKVAFYFSHEGFVWICNE